ncbi:MAG: hypothetical protein ABGZ17_17775 [Planctomycetaceae bacterium]
MNKSRDNLMQLIRLMEGLLPSEDEYRLRTELAEDRSLWQRFGQLQKLWDQNPLTVGELSSSHRFDEESLAAFVEGRLKDEEAEHIESICWDSPAALSDVISTFRFHRHDAAEPDVVVSSRLTQRLKSLGNDRLAMSGMDNLDRPGEDTVDDLVDATNSSLPDAIPIVIAMGKVERLKRSSYAFVAATALAVVAVLAASVWFLVAHQPEDLQFVEDQQPALPRVEPDQSLPPAPKREPQGGNIAQGQEEKKDNEPSRPIVVDQQGPVPPVVHQLPKPEPTPRRRSQSIQWVQTTGLIARRDAGSSKWVGLEYGSPETGPTTYSALSGSWAEAEFRQGFGLVLDSGSQVRIADRDQMDEPQDIELSFGRVALINLDENLSVKLHVGPVDWTLRAIVSSTSLGVVWSNTRPILFVAAGTVAVAGREYSRGREVAWANGQFQRATSLQTDTKWLRTPTHGSTLDEEWRQTMLLSDDLQGALLQYRAGNSSESKAATRWSFALYGLQHIPRALNAQNPQIRRDAVDWMLSVQQGDQRLQRVLAHLSQQLGEQRLKTRIAAWLQAARDPRHASRSTAVDMARALSHTSLAVRHIADQLLRVLTKRSPTFQPDGSPAQRRRDLSHWTQIVRQFQNR